MPWMLARYLAIVSVLCWCLPAQAQIYACQGPDGTRVYSDQKCGPNAKPVPGITTQKRASKPAAKTTGKTATKTAKTPTPRKTPAELQELMTLCKAGDVKACTTWTHGGGPNDLRQREKQAEVACESGSLPDCELRYCSDGVTDECRQRVMESAKVSGDTWYLREEAQIQDDGSILYKVRCVVKDVMEIRDTTVECSIDPGPQRCRPSQLSKGFARLDQAAAGFCAVNPRVQVSDE